MSNTGDTLTRQEQVYAPLTDYLRGVDPGESAEMSFAGLEETISRTLPPQARQNETWWESTTKRPQSRAWLRADRRAIVDLRTEVVTFAFEVFTRGQSLVDLQRMRTYWLAYARRQLEDVNCLTNVEHGWWEPHEVYLLHLPASQQFKVGLTRLGSKRLAAVGGSSARVVDRFTLANRWAALVLEHHVLELGWEAWEPPDRFATGDKGETERWSDWLVPPPLSVVCDSLSEDRRAPGWATSVFRKES